MARKREVERAKRRLLIETKDRDWIQGVGVGLVEGRIGLIVSVAPKTKPAASRLLRRLDLDVPTQIRAVGEIRARKPGKTSASQSIDMLRSVAQARLGGSAKAKVGSNR